MNKEELCLVRSSCKIFEIKLNVDRFYCEKASWDSASGVYCFGKKNTKYKFYKEELNQLYKENQI